MAEAREGMTRRGALLAGGSLLGAGLLTACGAGGAVSSSRRRTTEATTAVTTNPLLGKTVDYVDPFHAKVAAAGYRQKRARVGEVDFSYAEGPDNGPPLVLLHAQQMDWFSYSRVLPSLAKSFHVFDVDYQGHGRTTTPDDYPMNANRIGADLAAFMAKVVKGRAFVSGNSSGGLLAAWLAAERPDLVRAALLEDPPLFSSEYPRIKKTIADRDFKTSNAAVEEGVEDFLLFWIKESKAFFTKNVGPGASFLLTEAVEADRKAHPGRPVELGIIPNDTLRLFLRGMDHQYDPRFGAAFYNGTWNKGFDHAKALRRIKLPVMLMQANYSWTDGDILDGAMDKRDAAKALSLLRDGTYKKVDATHVVNLDKPAEFTRILEEFFLG